MSLTTDIYNAIAPLVTAFAAAQSPALPVAYPGLPLDPTPDDGIWLDFRVFWNDGEELGWDDSGMTVERGFFRVIVCSQPGEGIVASQQIAELLVAEFAKGTEFSTARVDRSPTIGGPIVESDRVMIPVTVWWRATR